MKNLYFYNTDIGKIGIADNGKAITNVYFNESPQLKDTEIMETDLLKEAAQQLKDYLAGKRKNFNIPLMPEGTEFQQNVWKALQQIPYGKTCTYGEIARKIGNPKACRAVGMANNKNPIGIFIPCHRVIGANGRLVGYAGGLEMKEHLLAIEKINADK